jgi:outer membrane protein assembly factor BamB
MGRAAVFVLLVGCGPDMRDPAVSSASDGASESGMTTEGESESSTGIEPWDPASGCDARFDLRLPPGAIAWTEQFAVSPEDRPGASAVAVDRRGLVYAAGFFRAPDPNADLHGWLHALSADGEPRWEVRYERDTLQQAFTDVAVDPSGDVIVVGHELISASRVDGDPPDAIAVVLRYSPAGEMLWRTEMDDVAEHSTMVAVGSDGRIVVAGRSQHEVENPFPGPPFVADLAETGALLDRWIPTSDPFDLLGPADVTLDSEGTLYLLATGVLANSADRTLWVGRWDSAGSFIGALVDEERGAQAIAMSPRAGGAIVLSREGDYVPWLRRFDAQGDVLWSHPVGAEIGLDARGLTTDCDGHAIVVAESWDGEAWQNWLFRFDDHGAPLERIRLGTEYGWTFESVAADPFGNAVLGGRAWVDDDDAFVVRKVAR